MLAGRQSAAGKRSSDTEDWLLMARMASTCLEVDATIAEDAHRRRDLAALAAARERSLPILLQAEARGEWLRCAARLGSRRQADLAIRVARAFRARIEGRDDPATWTELAVDWAELGDPYEAARARLARGPGSARSCPWAVHANRRQDPLIAAAEGAYNLGAWPLLAGRRRVVAARHAAAPQAHRGSPGGRLEPPASPSGRSGLARRLDEGSAVSAGRGGGWARLPVRPAVAPRLDGAGDRRRLRRIGGAGRRSMTSA